MSEVQHSPLSYFEVSQPEPDSDLRPGDGTGTAAELHAVTCRVQEGLLPAARQARHAPGRRAPVLKCSSCLPYAVLSRGAPKPVCLRLACARCQHAETVVLHWSFAAPGATCIG